MIVFSYLTDFCYFPLEQKYLKIAEHDQNRSIMDLLKRGEDDD
jgi:hypothetical protein